MRFLRAVDRSPIGQRAGWGELEVIVVVAESELSQCSGPQRVHETLAQPHPIGRLGCVPVRLQTHPVVSNNGVYQNQRLKPVSGV